MNKRRLFSLCAGSLVFLLVMPCQVSGQKGINKPATLIFGQGGGVTGKYTEYILGSDRKLFSYYNSETGKKVLLKKISKKLCRSFFTDAENLGLLKMDFNHPYNINYYIIYHKGTDENKVNWCDARNPPPEGVKELWERLWEVTKESTKK